MNFVKVMYFDEGSAADYIQITSGGEFKKTVEFISEVTGDAGTSVNGEVSIDAKKKGIPALFKALTGFGIDASVKAHAGVETKGERIAKTILENTLLADFVTLIESDNKKKNESNKRHKSIKQFHRINLHPQINSFSYFMLAAPFFTMIEGDVPISGENGEKFKLDIAKIESAISRGRGYYEFIATIDDKEKIFRFSSTSFRNNYTMSDLPKMSLSLYAVPVGTIDKKKLDITSEFEFGVVNKDRIEYDPGSKESSVDKKIEVYDVILAGIAEE